MDIPSGNNDNFAMENHLSSIVGISTISTGPFSIAMLVITIG